MVNLLFVCMGNICRSPTAEGVFRERVRAAGLSEHIQTDSAGTHDYHIGRAPDPRSLAEAARRGVDISDLRARQVDSFDYGCPILTTAARTVLATSSNSSTRPPPDS
jgi:protein-tyrosine phosphatase